MNKPKVVFTFVDAGSGHIVPLSVIYKAFEKKYGKYVDLVKSDFFFENKNPKLAKLGKYTKHGVVYVNKNWLSRNFIRLWTAILPTKIGLYFMTHNLGTIGTEKAAFEHIKELKADVHVSNHFFPSYFYQRYKKQKDTLNLLINQDCLIIKNDLYPTDVLFTTFPCNMVDYPKKYKRLNNNNFKLIPYPIREEFVNIDIVNINKNQQKAKFNLDPEKFTIAILEGGYGVGKGIKVLKRLIKTNLKLNIMYFVGKNEKILQDIKKLNIPENITILPIGYTTQIAHYLLAADLALVKSGPSVLAETAALGLPTISIQYGFVHEIVNAEFYRDTIGNALFITKPKKIVEKIEELYNDPQMLKQLSTYAINNHLEYNSEKIADALFEEIKKRFPNLDK